MLALVPSGMVGTTVFAFLLIWAIILIHELGHYYAGRRITGIPRDEIKLVTPYLPRYVALRDGEEWVGPTRLQQYRSAYRRHDPDREHERRFAAAGDLIQAGVVAPIGLAVGIVVDPDVGVTILSASLLVFVVYAAIDAVGTLYRGNPSGDYSLLWTSTPALPITLALAFSSLHIVALTLLI
ncbi:hypothetical protein GRX03_12850 [Halovenus sp. WSH3]|uniref:Peptidase M50 domain-containing protein n=1 Tax=Halovenus carboxidivorans TaxID=2692199 RepID=A0A6B0TB95_9EURY|nr:hypothetical protein [Halovenus carboxidivorans]MXR52491.1 hypothetical protein [Halovenus carboxidivorans]